MTEWERRLVDAGCRLTAARRAVATVLTEADAPLSPQELLDRAAAIHPQLGLVTVYRTLALLEGLDLARRVHRASACHDYVASLPGQSYHIICSNCGRAEKFLEAEGLRALIGQVERHTGYHVESHLLQLEGLCPGCREAAS